MLAEQQFLAPPGSNPQPVPPHAPHEDTQHTRVPFDPFALIPTEHVGSAARGGGGGGGEGVGDAEGRIHGAGDNRHDTFELTIASGQQCDDPPGSKPHPTPPQDPQARLQHTDVVPVSPMIPF